MKTTSLILAGVVGFLAYRVATAKPAHTEHGSAADWTVGDLGRAGLKIDTGNPIVPVVVGARPAAWVPGYPF